MDTNLHFDIFKHHNPHHCDFINYDVSHPIRRIMFDHHQFIDDLVSSGKARPVVLDNIERSLLCRTVYLGYDLFECPNCGNENIAPRFCHSRFCNTCGVKYSKQLAAKVSSFVVDVPHRHIVFTIPQELRNWFRQDRSRLNILFVAARNTICALTNKKLFNRMKKKNLKNGHYLYKDFHHKYSFAMVSTIHTFGRDLKWNPHIHSLVPELIYDSDKDKIKRFHHFNFTKLRKTFQFELIRLIEETGGLSNKHDKNKLYKKHSNGFYVYAKYDKDDNEDDNDDHVDDVTGCVSYCMRYAGRPAMAESRIIKYDRESDTVEWFYHDHKDNQKHTVIDSAIDFIKKLIIHIPDYHFRNIRYYGYYSNASNKMLDRIHELLGQKKKKDYSRKKRSEHKTKRLNLLKYRTHLIDSFNRDPLKCKCGHYLRFKYTYDPLEGRHNDRGYRRECIDEMHSMQIRRRRTIMGSG
jgi:hypothetical protein